MTDQLRPPAIQLWAWPMTVRPDLDRSAVGAVPVRIGDAERDRAVSDLGDHFAAGRLTREEFDARVDQAMAARFDRDLQPLFVDLPRAEPVPSRPAGPPTGPAHRLAAAALVAAAAAGGCGRRRRAAGRSLVDLGLLLGAAHRRILGSPPAHSAVPSPPRVPLRPRGFDGVKRSLELAERRLAHLDRQLALRRSRVWEWRFLAVLVSGRVAPVGWLQHQPRHHLVVPRLTT